MSDEQTRSVTGVTEVTHRPGDKPVDSVDNTVNALSLRVTETPNGVAEGSRVRDNLMEQTQSVTDSSQKIGPNEENVEHTTGRDLARSALAAVRAKAQARGIEPGVRKPGKASDFGQNPRRRRWSAPGADPRDPQPLGRLIAGLTRERGWSDRLNDGRVFGQWAQLVGDEVAEHAQPIALKDGELTVQASSTAWATQLRLLQRQLLAKIAAGVGHGVVKRMRIHGPAAPSWRKGARHIPGRGPRDTYG
jgi:predicted nucleic acid-binding Zn ribbon protein